ncbi:MAG: hypothetical protein ORN24_01950, partial [Burkholderiales bacterium]|nr:hypothetical protein [Burkholderiales bacterium]
NKLFNKDECAIYQDHYIEYILQTSIGFAGAEICRRICGIAGVKEIRNITDVVLKNKAEDMALNAGVFMVENFKNINRIQDLIVKISDF